MIDMYDEEIVKVTNLLMEMQNKWGPRPNNQKNLAEMATEIKDRFFKLGFVVDVDLVPCIQVDASGKSFPPEVIVMSRVKDFEFDHEKKGFEVKRSKTRGEKYDGLRETANKKPKRDAA